MLRQFVTGLKLLTTVSRINIMELETITPTKFIIKKCQIEPETSTAEHSRHVSVASFAGSSEPEISFNSVMLWKISSSSSEESSTPFKFRFKKFSSPESAAPGCNDRKWKAQKSRSPPSEYEKKPRTSERSATATAESRKQLLMEKFQVYKSQLLLPSQSGQTRGSSFTGYNKTLEQSFRKLNRDQKRLKKMIRLCKKDDWSKLSSEEVEDKKRRILNSICLTTDKNENFETKNGRK